MADLKALAQQLDALMGNPPGTTPPGEVERLLGVTQRPVTAPGAAVRPTVAPGATIAPGGPLGPVPTGKTVKVDVEGVGALEFPASMPEVEIKDYLDRTYGPNKPRSATPLGQDIAGTVTEPLAHLRESVKKPHPYGAPTLKDISSLLGLAASPFEAAGRVTERAWEKGAGALQGRPPRSTWPSTIAGFAGALTGPSLALRGLRGAGRLLGARPGPALPPGAARPRLRFGPEGLRPVSVPGLQGAQLALGRPLPGIGSESAVGGVSSFVGRLLSPLYSRMEALGPEGFEASRLLRRAHLGAMERTARDVQPLVDTIKQLSTTQRRQLFRHLHKGEQATDPAVAQTAAAYSTVFGPQGILPQQMTAAGLQMFSRQGGRRVAVGPFQTRKQFYPLEYTGAFKAKLFENAQFSEKLAEELVRSAQVPTLVQARRIVKQFIEGRKLGKERPSPGEYHREIELPGFIQDPAEAVMLRGWRTARRLSEIEHLGHKDARLEALVQRLRTQNPEKAGQLETYIDIALGGRRGLGGAADRRLGRMARTARSVQAFFKLPLAVIPNMSQSVWTAFRTDAASTLQALGKHIFRRSESVRAAKELGAYSDIAARQLMQEYASEFGERALGVVLRPFNQIERFNRVVSANAGMAWAKRLEAAVQRHQARQAPRLFRELRRLGFAEDEAQMALVARRFNPEQHRRIALEIVDQTQFIPAKGGRSEFFNSELGSTLGQFKTFSMNLGRMLNRTVLDELRAGNPRPAIKLLFYAGVPMQVAGEIVSDMRAVITGRQRPSLHAEWGLRMVENFTSVGALGIATDALISLTSGRSLVDFMQGPTLDDASRLISRIAGLAGSDTPEEAARQGVELGRFAVRRAIPYLGPAISGKVIRPTAPAPGHIKDPTDLDLLGLTPRAHMSAGKRSRERQKIQRRRWRQYQP